MEFRVAQTTIMVIEGARRAAERLRYRLEHVGYRVSTLVPSSMDILPAVVAVRPDVVLTNVQLPAALDGMTVAVLLQERLDVPVIYLAASPELALFQHALATAPYGYLFYPCDVRHMTHTIETALARHAAERHTRDQARLLALTLQSLEDPLIATDVQGRVTQLNPSAADLTGWRHDEALGHSVATVLQLLHPAKALPLEHPALHAIRAQQAVWFPLDTVLATRDGRRLPLAGCAAPIRTPDAPLEGVVIVCRDLTAQRRLETQRHQAQTMQMLETLTGGMAHHFNNMLNGIMGFTELALDSLPSESPVRNYLEHVLKAGQRASDLVYQMLAFSRQQRLERYPVNPAMILDQVLLSLRETLPAQVTIREEVECKDGAVLGDATQLHEVVKHLCSNALHAMRDAGGVLHIRLVYTEVDEAFAAKHPALQLGPYLHLTVADTGHGMAPAVLEHLFEPFFTTKEVGEGAGMGLAVVHGIVTHHEGAILVESTPGEGTTVHVYLPAALDSLA